jgi:hypothetical protein
MERNDDPQRKEPATSEEAAGLKPAGMADREETPGETCDEAARRQMCAVLVKILFNLSRDFESAAYKVGKR